MIKELALPALLSYEEEGGLRGRKDYRAGA
jgi:hypothetical protein